MADDSVVEIGKGGTMITGEDGMRMFRAFTLASALKLYAKTGMIPTRGVTITRMLKMATEYTGKTYKRGSAATAAEDVHKWAREMRAAIPTVVRD